MRIVVGNVEITVREVERDGLRLEFDATPIDPFARVKAQGRAWRRVKIHPLKTTNRRVDQPPEWRPESPRGPVTFSNVRRAWDHAQRAYEKAKRDGTLRAPNWNVPMGDRAVIKLKKVTEHRSKVKAKPQPRRSAESHTRPSHAPRRK